MTIQSKKLFKNPKALFAGIDVGAEELILFIRKNDTSCKKQKFANAPADRARLVKKLVNLPGIIVCETHPPVHKRYFLQFLHPLHILCLKP